VLYETTIVIPTDEIQECQKFLDSHGQDKIATFETYTGKFSNGVEVDIKVCDGDPPFVDPVLFEDGCELATGEVRDALLGEYRFKVGEDEYKVTVLPLLVLFP
jgi:hypothetical protein